MKLRPTTTLDLSFPGALKLALALAVGALLVLAPLAARANAAASDFPSSLYLSGATSGVVTVTTNGAKSRTLVGSVGIGGGLAAPTGVAVAGTGMGAAFPSWTYVYTLVDNGAETAPSAISANIATTAANANVQLTLPAGLPANVTVRIYRKRTQHFYLIGSVPSSSTTYTDAAAENTTLPLIPQAQNRLGFVFGGVCGASNCGYAEFLPGTPVNNFPAPPSAQTVPTALTATASTTPSNTGWLVDTPGPVDFASGTWTFRAQYKSGVHTSGTAHFVVGLWKVKVSGGAIDAANSTLLIDPNGAGEQTTTNLINNTNSVQTVTHTVAMPVVSLAAGEYLYVQFWRRQTLPYLAAMSADARTITLYANDGFTRLEPPAADDAAPNPFGITSPGGNAFIKNGQSLQSNPSDPTPGSGLASVAYYYCLPFADCTFGPKVLIGSSAASPYFFTWAAQPADGAYQLVAVATDNVGRTADTAVVPITVDNTAPDTTLTSTPSNPSNGSPSFSFSSGEPGTFECRVDTGAFASCSSPDAPGGLASGSHTFEVRAVDRALNLDATPATFTWTVDATNPTASFSSTPPNPSPSAAASFSFSADEPATLECRLDAAAFAACTSPRNLTGVADGSHTFEVRGTDAVGNVGSAAAFTWTIDTITPVVSFTSTPPNPSGSASASFSFSVSEPATVECSLDGAPYAACSSPDSLTGLAEGSHTFQVRATDSVGHVGSATYTWTVDTVTPTVSFTSTPPSAASSKAANFSFSVSEPATIECGLDGGAFAACTSPRNLSNLADGSHTFEVHATDGVGHVGSATYTWTVDTVAPVVSFGSTPPSPTNTAATTFSFSANEAATLECRLDNAAYATCSSPNSVSVSDGSHTLAVRATDAAGHVGTASFTWTVDTFAPSTPALDSPFAAAPTRSLRLTAVYTGPEPGGTGHVEFRVCTDAACANLVASGGSEQVVKGATAAWAINVALADGTYYWQARSVDLAGNVSGWSNVWNFTRDTTSPAAPDGFTGVVAADGLTLRWTAPPGEQIGNYVVYVNGKQWRVLGEVTYEVKVGPFDAGDTRSFSVSAIDSAGNEGPQATALVGVPDLVGLSLAAAKDAVETRGLVLDDLRTVSAEASPAFVIAQTPPAPSLAPRGSEVAVVLGAMPTIGDRPLVEIDSGRVCGAGGFLYLQVRLRERAKVNVSVYDTRAKRLALRRLGFRPPGLTNHSLHLPKALGRPGRYRVVVTAKATHRSGRDTMSIIVKRPSRRGGARTGC